MTPLNYLGLAGQAIFGVSSMVLLLIAFMSCHWKWFATLIISILLFFVSSIVAMY